MGKKIWFNRWFSTAYNIIDCLRACGDQFEIYTTHSNKYSLNLLAGDFAEVEPDINGEEYIEYCLDFCKKHEIDVFCPHNQMLDICRKRDKFNDIGVKVLISPVYETLSLIEDKEALYKFIELENEKDFIVDIPEYYKVKDFNEFSNACNLIRSKDKIVCFKPNSGIGGIGFHVLRYDSLKTDSILKTTESNVLFSVEVYNAFIKKFPEQPLLVMEYMNGPEYSIDCVSSEGELLVAIPRKKMGNNSYLLEDNKELIEIAKKISKQLNMSYNFNIQVRIVDGKPMLLEINGRMSGGTHYSSMAGANLPYIGVKTLLGENVVIPTPHLNILVRTKEDLLTTNVLD